MLAPLPRRPNSRASVATTATTTSTAFTLSPPDSWSSQMGRGGSRATSVTEWSDQGTEVPLALPKILDEQVVSEEGYEGAGWGDEPPLIDFDDEPVQVTSGPMDRQGSENDRKLERRGESHAEKLRMLLQQMEMEVHQHQPVSQEQQKQREVAERSPMEIRSKWRDGRRTASGRISAESAHDDDDAAKNTQAEQVSPRMDNDVEDDRASEEELEMGDSPPTPPLRFNNPYSARRTSGDKSVTSPAQSRITSRAAVLRNSTSSVQSGSSSSSRQPAAVPARSKTPLETFIETHETPAAFRQVSDPSSSRSFDRSTRFSTSSSSRKGKERAYAEHQEESDSRSTRHSRQTPMTRSSRRSHTPRKWSVELAPEDSAAFAQEAASLEVRGDMDLDLEESVDEPPWESDMDDSRVEEPFATSTYEEGTIRDRSNPSRLSRVLSRPKSSPKRKTSRDLDTSLPPLPEPSYDSSEEDNKADKISSRQASLFRSPTRTLLREQKSLSTSRSFTREPSKRSVSPNSTLASQVYIAPPEPIRVGMAHVSTPVKANATLSVPTPHPPGRWYSPGVKKSSPLSREVEQSLSVNEDVSVHRLKLSPAKKSPSPRKETIKLTEEDETIGESSFIGRIPGLSRMIAKSRPAPQPSETLQEAREALSRAAQSSSSARTNVEKTQRQFLEALAAAQAVGGGAMTVARRGWTWGNWAWWLSVEALLVWGVFRVTLDYATSAHHLSGLDPFALSAANSFALSVPLPTAISAFIVPHRGSANFFDLLERMDLWKRLDELGVFGSGSEVVVGGVRMLGGVPT